MTVGPGAAAAESAGAGISFVIAVDGPSGTGKSTVSRRVAAELGAGYLDTGAMYRIVALAVLQAEIDPADDDAVANLLPRLTFDSPTQPEAQDHRLGDTVVTADIRGQQVTLAVTPVAANPAVRTWLLERQQRLARSGRMVVEGRDIGTVVAPDAELKIYLTADPAERARRRHRQNRSAVTDPGAPASSDHDPAVHDLAAVALDLERRDTHDSNREHAPLQVAPDAVVIDSSTHTLAQTVGEILELARRRGIE